MKGVKIMEENNVVKKEDNSKKKKIIIAVVVAVIIIGVAAAVYFAVNKDDNGYTDVPVAQTVTNENGEAVTDANGNVVTENAAAQGSKPQTTNNNAGGGNNQQQNNDSSNNNQGGGSASGSDAEEDKKPDDNPVDTKPKNRKIKITAELPQGHSADDIMEIWVNGEKDSEITVRDYLDGKNKAVVTTENKYKGDAEVVVLLRNYKTQTPSATVANNVEEITVVFPLNKVESFEGEDD